MDALNGRIDMRLVVIAAVGIGLVALGVLLIGSADATITGDAPPGYGDWVINNPTEVYDEFIWLTDGNITVNSKLTIDNTFIIFDWLMYPIEYKFHVTAGGSMSLTNSYVVQAWGLGIEYIFEGMAYIDTTELYHAWNGVQIRNDNVEIYDTAIVECYNLGVHIRDCDPILDNVYVDVPYGYWTTYYKTDMSWDWESPLMLACPNGLWVEGGAPSFTDVYVTTRSEARFEIEYTGKESSALMYLWAAGAPVMIESTDIVDVTGLVADYCQFRVRTTVTATDPSPNPRNLEIYMQAICAGILVKDYADVTITGVDAVGCRISSTYLSVSGASSYNYGYRYTPWTLRIVTAIVGTYSTSPTTSVTLKDYAGTDGDGLYTHMYSPDYVGGGTPVFTDTVLVQGLDMGNYGDPIITVQRSTTYQGAREMVWRTQVTNCDFHDMYGPALEYMASPGPGLNPTQQTIDVTESIRIANSTFSDCWLDYNRLFYIDGVWNNLRADIWDRRVEVVDCTFTDIYGTLFDAYSVDGYQAGTETFLFINNEVTRCGQDTYYYSGFFYVEYFENVRFLGNTFGEVAYPYPGVFSDEGGDSNGVKPTDFLFQGNQMTMCMAYFYPTFFYTYFGGDMTFDSNSFSEGTGLVLVDHVPDYAGPCKMTLTQNDYFMNSGPMVYYYRADEAQRQLTIQIDNNTIYENYGYVIDYEWSQDIDSLDNDGLILFMDNDVHDNMAGVVHAWGDVRVLNNDFSDNMGPVATIDYINLNLPTITGNSYSGNVDLFDLVAKDRGYQLVPMSIKDLSLDCTGTALSLTNIEATMERVTIQNAEKALIADNSIVQIYYSDVDGNACEVFGIGHITVWWPAEVSVTWADANGADSTEPASGALIVFYDEYGSYFYSANTDAAGMLASAWFREWRVDIDGLWTYTPYTVKIALAGAVNEHSVAIDRDLTGANAVKVLLWDTFKPVVAITNPLGGALFNTPNVDVRGFISEIGSGLTLAESSTDAGASWDPLAVDPDTGDWMVSLMDLGDGEHSLMVKAYDLAGNTVSSGVSFMVDTSAPVISVTSPGDGETLDMPNVDLVGGVDEAGVTLFVNGERLALGEDTSFTIPMLLNEGLNLLVIEALDMAGNHAMHTMTVTVDTFEPSLVLTSPASGKLTSEGTITVTGIVEVGATLLVNGMEVTEDSDGSFSKVVDLVEGSNNIEVKAIDVAGNTNLQVRTVTRDSTPPTVSIVEPADRTTTKDGQIVVRVNAAPDATVYLNGRMLPTKGLVNRTILLVEGENLITVQAIDAAGNVAEAMVTVILDTVPPVLTVTAPARTEVWTNMDTLTLGGRAVGAKSVTVNGVAATTFDAATGNFTAQASLVSGENNITVTASDGANSVSLTLKAWMSTTSPVLVVDAIPQTVQQPTVTVKGRTDVGIRKVSVKVGSQEQMFDVDYDGTFAVKLTLPDGDYTAQVSVTNVYGNTATQSSTPFTIKAVSLTGGEEETGLSIQPMGLGAVIAAIGITIALVTWMVVRSTRRRR